MFIQLSFSFMAVNSKLICALAGLLQKNQAAISVVKILNS